jgi:N-acetylmuramoyl-L-alanine amidase
MSTALHFGRFLPKNLFRTSEGDFFLSISTLEDVAQAKKNPFPTALEREGQFAAIKGILRGDVILEVSLVEAVPPITSQVLSRLVEERSGVRSQILKIAREVKDELVGAPVPVPPKEVALEVKASGPSPLCVLDIGHSPTDQGAEGKHEGTKIKEYSFNKGIAERVEQLVKNARIITISRHPEGLTNLPAKTNALNPNFVISLHANGDDGSGTARGTEVLHFESSAQGKKLAGILQKHFLAALGLRDRGLKARTAADRGGSQLVNTRAPIVIGEPFFITNTEDLAVAMSRKEELAAAYAAAIDEYAATLANPAPSAVTTREVPSHIEPATTFAFETAGLTKEAFLSRNRDSLNALIAAINGKLSAKYGAGFTALTRADVCVITYIECGLRGGLVDPDHRHSEGERGMLPLPSNIRDWNGSDAPAWDRPMPVAKNLEHFYLYLGHLKNKDVSGAPRHLYRDLFKLDRISGNAVREAKLLAGVVHGYFYSGNYRPGPVPFDRLIRGYQNDTRLSTMMSGTTYVHAGTSVITGREANIDTALGLV